MLSISGFGQDGPERDRASYAGVIHAETGVVARRRTPADGALPLDIEISMADTVTGLHGVIGVLVRAAPARRDRARPARRHGDDRRHGVQRRLPAQRGRRRAGPPAPRGGGGAAERGRRRRRAPPHEPERDHRRARRAGDRDGRVQVDLEVDQRAPRRRRPDAARRDARARRSPPAARRGATSTRGFATRDELLAALDRANLAWGIVRAGAEALRRRRRSPTAGRSSRSTTPTAPTP